MPMRRLYLNLKSVVVEGKKPFVLPGMSLFGGASKEPATSAAAGSTIGLELNKSRSSMGIEVLKKYIDCAKYIAMMNASRNQNKLANSENKLTEEGDENYEGNMQNTQDNAGGDTFKGDLDDKYDMLDTTRISNRERRLSLNVRRGVTSSQRRASFLSRKRHLGADLPFTDGEEVNNTEEGGDVVGSSSSPRVISRRRSTLTKKDQNQNQNQKSSLAANPNRVKALQDDGSKSSHESSAGGSLRKERAGHKLDKEELGDPISDESLNPGGSVELEAEPKEEEINIDKDALREVQVFFNGQFVHELMVPIIYTDSPDADIAVNDNALNAALANVILFVPRGQRLDSCRLDLVIYSLTKHAKKDAIVGLRIFEGHMLEALFDHQHISKEQAETGAEGILTSAAANPNSADTGASVNANQNQNQIVMSPRAGEANVYDMEAPGQFNGNNQEGVALAVEKLEMNGAAEVDYEDVVSGLNLGVRSHASHAPAPDRAMSREGRQHSRRQVQVRLVAVKGLLESNLVPPAPSAGGSHVNGAANNTNTTNSPRGDGDKSVVSVSQNTFAASLITDGESMESEQVVEPLSDTDEIVAVVRWNGQEIGHSHHMSVSNSMVWSEAESSVGKSGWGAKNKAKKGHGHVGDEVEHPKLPITDPMSSSVFTMHIPVGHRLRGCYLEIDLCRGEDIIGSTVLHGDELVSFLEGFGSVETEEELYDEYDEDDDVTQTTRNYPLEYSPYLPRQRQLFDICGRIFLRGRCDTEEQDVAQKRPKTTTNPFSAQTDNQFHTSVNIKKKTHFVPMFKIRSKMPSEDFGWRFFFDKGEQARVIEYEAHFLEEKMREENAFVKGNAVRENNEQKSEVVTFKNSRNSMTGDDDDEDDLSLVSAHSLSRNNTNNSNKSVVDFPDSRTGINIPVDFGWDIRKNVMELSAVKYVKVKEELQEDCRICWRGRAMPKHFKGGMTGEGKNSMMKSRASRVIKTKAMNMMKLLTDVHFLEDFGDEKEVTLDALPIEVKEIVSKGPGLCTRVYRIEISTNSGQSIGQFDIDNDDDMIKAVGIKNADLFGFEGRGKWSMEKLFAFIVNDRTTIDFMPTKKATKNEAKKKITKGRGAMTEATKNRREAMSSAAAGEFEV